MPTPSSWWEVVKAVAFELRPFPMPTRGDVAAYSRSALSNAAALASAARAALAVTLRASTLVSVSGYLRLGAWLGAWWLCARAEFGVVFLILSAIAAMFVNLGEEGERGEFSAYSVFNAGCRAILGTLDAQQLERELMHQDVRGGGGAGGGGGDRSDDDGDEDGFVMVDMPGQRRGEGESLERSASRGAFVAGRAETRNPCAPCRLACCGAPQRLQAALARRLFGIKAALRVRRSDANGARPRRRGKKARRNYEQRRQLRADAEVAAALGDELSDED
ncbi:hypothetical protein JKP88DRAFT_348327 [Tribonema minus]|uniref:SAYSvFN domain-containing protein n=1 Tax=Tribonema minus TaxID=303371 RepID=A0A835Z1K3_9STRA|nr:hypothetical protein JKP88DRAFT_348327 [Tribonema minus]